ncbi:NADH-quinone oxidoreductase subunit L [Nostocoides sp. F2B08]|uniref:NADH-quinone oxidoreductase subunit 5 family protein n=1 Tax=Nostocoides sp. F2B08 TaxID=2653936 RepID=UPI00186B5223|nr:proton-conducting transporter membrane subunit [Tetrasphaera sp. F2B08]
MTPESVALHLPVVATILIPFAAAVLGLGVARRGPAVDVALFGGFLALVSAAYRLIVLPENAPGDGGLTTFSSGLPAVALGELTIPFELAVSARSALLSALVAAVTLAVLAFAAWYLREDDRRGVFLATVSLFAAAMQLVVHSADLVLTLVGWEVMGFCSYLLIGHWSRTERARRAAYKSFVVTRLADVGFVLGVVILASGARSTGYAEVLQHWTQNAGTALTVAMACLVVAVLGKSAQVPFQDWLPDAMAGPTPASALIHAATMVAAGTVVLAQLAPLLALAAGAQWLLAVSVSATMLLGAALAFGQSDLKALLAWSTVSQVAIMLAPLAVLGAVGDAGTESSAAALFHLYAHALFKALLFLTLGWLSLSLHSTLASRLQGTARRWLSRLAVVVGLAALAGLPLVVGGWSKELVLATVADEAGATGARGWLVLAALLLTVVLTALYATRAALILLRPSAATGSAATAVADEDLSTGELRAVQATRAAQREAARQADAAPLSTRLVIGALTFATAFGGILLLAFERLLGVEAHLSLLWLSVTLALALLGIGLGWQLSRSGDPALRLGARQALADGGLGVDRLYLALVAAPVLALARGVATVDRRVVDAPVRAVARQAVRWSDMAGERHPTGPLSAVSMVGVVLVVLLAVAVTVAALGGIA